MTNKTPFFPGQCVNGLIVDMDITTGNERTIAAHKPRSRAAYWFTLDPKTNEIRKTEKMLMTYPLEFKRKPPHGKHNRGQLKRKRYQIKHKTE